MAELCSTSYTSGCLEKSIGTKGKLSKDTRDITVLNNVVLEVNREALVLKAIKSTSFREQESLGCRDTVSNRCG